MKLTTRIASLVVLMGVVPSVVADISGKVTLKGTPPPEKEITPAVKDPLCGKLHSKAPTTRHYVVGADSGLGNVFVYVKKGHEGKAAAASGEKPLMDQVGCLYEPYVLGAMAGQTVQIRNSDPLMHNVNYAMSKSGNAVFNFAQATKGQVNEKAFAKPEVFVKLQCNVHPWMFGYIGVVDSPFHAVTDKDGKFAIKGLPDGKYTLAFVHLKAGEVTQDVEVKGGNGTAAATLEVKAQP